MNIQLSEHFTYRKLLRFTFPSIVMMVFSSIYGVVDGVFVSNFVGSEPFAAINLIMPFLMILGAVGFMLGTGGSALVAYTLGAGDEKRANEIFSLLIYVLIGLGLFFTVAGLIFLEPVSRLLGADEVMLPYCVAYGRIILLSGSSGAAELRAVYHGDCRCLQHGSGRAVHRCLEERRSGRCHGDGDQSVAGRHHTVPLFSAAE